MVQGELQGDVQQATLARIDTKSSSLRKTVEDLYAANHCLLIMF